MFRQWVGVGLGALGGAAAGASLAFVVLNSKLAELAQDSEGNLLVNDSNVYWSLITVGSMLGGYWGMKLSSGKLSNEARLKAVGYNTLAVPEDLCDPITLSIFQDPVINPHKQTYSRATLAILRVDSTDPSKRICAMTQQAFDPEAVVPDALMTERVELFVQQQVELRSGKIKATTEKALALPESEETLGTLSQDPTYSNASTAFYVAQSSEEVSLAIQAPLLSVGEGRDSIRKIDEFNPPANPLVLDLETGVNQSGLGLQLELREAYFSPSCQAQGSPVRFFTPASSAIKPPPLLLTSLLRADEPEEDGWVLDFGR